MKRELTCIVCPMGCKLEVELDGDKVISVTGNTCPRGEGYAVKECTHPERVITSTVILSDGTPLPVRTSAAIPKELIFDCMKEINAVRAKAPIKIGDVIIENVLSTGADIIATANR